MSTPLHVCHLIGALERGGAEAMLAKLCESHDRTRARFSVVALHAGPLEDRFRRSDVPLEIAGLDRGRIPRPREVLRVARLLRDARPEVIHGWMYHGNLAATLLAPRGVPVLWNIRQTLYDVGREPRLTRAIIRAGAALSRRPVATVYNSHVSAAQHAAIGFRDRRPVVLPNGFDTARFAPDPDARMALRRELGLGPDALLVGHVARMHPMKDHGTMLAAVARLAGAWPTLHLVLAGEGIAPAAFAGQLPGEVQGRVHFLGAREDLPRLTAAFDVAALSSAWGEGFPNVLGEALACGVPVVCTDIGDAARVVGDAGRVVPPRNPAALAAAIAELLGDAELRRRLGAAGRQRVVAEFSIERVADRYVALYEAVARRPLAGDTFPA